MNTAEAEIKFADNRRAGSQNLHRARTLSYSRTRSISDTKLQKAEIYGLCAFTLSPILSASLRSCALPWKKQRAVTSELLGERKQPMRRSRCRHRDGGFAGRRNIAALKGSLGKLSHIRKRIFLIDQKVSLVHRSGLCAGRHARTFQSRHIRRDCWRSWRMPILLRSDSRRGFARQPRSLRRPVRSRSVQCSLPC